MLEVLPVDKCYIDIILFLCMQVVNIVHEGYRHYCALRLSILCMNVNIYISIAALGWLMYHNYYIYVCIYIL